MDSGECSAKLAEHSPASTLSGRRTLWSRCSASQPYAGQLGPGCRKVSKSMRRLARRAGPEQRRPGPERLLATLRRPRCSVVVTRCVRWRRSRARTRGSMKCPSTLPASMPSVWCIRHRTKHPGNRAAQGRPGGGCRSMLVVPARGDLARQRNVAVEGLVTTARSWPGQCGNVCKQAVSKPRALSEATGKLPYGLGQSVTSPTVLRAR